MKKIYFNYYNQNKSECVPVANNNEINSLSFILYTNVRFILLSLITIFSMNLIFNVQ